MGTAGTPWSIVMTRCCAIRVHPSCRLSPTSYDYRIRKLLRNQAQQRRTGRTGSALQERRHPGAAGQKIQGHGNHDPPGPQAGNSQKPVGYRQAGMPPGLILSLRSRGIWWQRMRPRPGGPQGTLWESPWSDRADQVGHKEFGQTSSLNESDQKSSAGRTQTVGPGQTRLDRRSWPRRFWADGPGQKSPEQTIRQTACCRPSGGEEQ